MSHKAPGVEAESDEHLMDRFCQGDVRAFEALFTRHARAVRRFLARASGDPNVAEDLAQATFLSLVRSRERFSKGSRFLPWLYAIGLNAARDWRRRHREQLSATGELPEPEAVAPAGDVALEQAVRRAVDALPETQREAVLLHRFEGLSFPEIAQIAGVSETAVKVRAHRGYERLRVALKGVWESL